ncbi:MAG: transcriptional regulator [Massilia sp.]|jgi:transcriptional regulator GlxA family with amidase domain|nr:transcriptional regulator [Massilia sp.]
MIKIAAFVCVASFLFASNACSAADAGPAVAAEQPTGKIAPYVARFGRTRPLVAVVGENSSTVLSDYVIPYGVLSQSGVADVVSLATQPGLLSLPPLHIQPDSTVAQFDGRYPEGADYVIVPAVMKRDDPALLAWVTAQAGKGATMVSICNGSLVLANAGLTRGHRATGHWSTHQLRLDKFPDTHWLKNVRYVADGKIVSSAGISASIPTSIALVEAIAGTDRANALAATLGVAYWGTKHNSDAFRITFRDDVLGFANTLFHATQDVGVPVAPGVDEIALALKAEAYSATFRSRVYAVAPALSAAGAPVRTRGGLMLVPDRVAGQGKQLDWTVPEWTDTPATQVLDKALADIVARYGAAAGRFVVLEAEYPWPGL